MAQPLWVIIGMALVTYIPRVLPLVILSRREIPPGLRCWLQFVPVSVLSALLVPGLLVQNGQLALQLNNHYLLAAIPSFLVAVKYRNIFLTVFCGIVSLMVIRALL